jgi:chloramphenicol-sensitive protein RarD
MSSNQPEESQQPIAGVLFAFLAFLIWGLSPIYWKALHGVGAFEIILHRILWSFVFLLPLVLISRRWVEFKKTVKAPGCFPSSWSHPSWWAPTG